MKCNELKNQVIGHVREYLQPVTQDEIIYIVTTNGSGVVAITENDWQLIDSSEMKNNYTDSGEAEVLSALQALVTIVVTATTGFSLHRNLVKFTGSMPGWWHFFNPLRPLTLRLKALNAQTVLAHVIEEDYNFFVILIAKLNLQIDNLLVEIEQLHAKNKLLNENVLLVTNQELMQNLEQLKFQHDELLSKNEDLRKQLVQFEQQAPLKRAEEKITELAIENKKLVETINTLKKEFQTVYQSVNVTNLTKTTRPSGSDQEIAARHNQSFNTSFNLFSWAKKKAAVSSASQVQSRPLNG